MMGYERDLRLRRDSQASVEELEAFRSLQRGHEGLLGDLVF